MSLERVVGCRFDAGSLKIKHPLQHEMSEWRNAQVKTPISSNFLHPPPPAGIVHLQRGNVLCQCGRTATHTQKLRQSEHCLTSDMIACAKRYIIRPTYRVTAFTPLIRLLWWSLLAEFYSVQWTYCAEWRVSTDMRERRSWNFSQRSLEFKPNSFVFGGIGALDKNMRYRKFSAGSTTLLKVCARTV